MFTGIVAATGVVRAVQPGSGSVRLSIEAGCGLAGTGIGDSIAVSGACLTVARLDGRTFEADLTVETLERTTLGRLRPGDAVNLELPVAVGDRLGGHVVQGHVDGVGRVARRARQGDTWWLEIEAPSAVARYIVDKGSVAVDGVSLTVTAIAGDRFTVCLIPHTCAVTTLGRVQTGMGVNLEADILAKYVERLLVPYARSTDEGPPGSRARDAAGTEATPARDRAAGRNE
jgi:riboflavin synthase